MRKNIILIIIGVLLGISLFLLITTLNLKKSLQDLSKEQQVEFRKQLDAEKEELKRNLEEKHRADKISYQAMMKRLELEKKKAKEMQKEIEEFKEKN